MTYVFELVKPGTWLEGIDDDTVRSHVETLLDLLETCLADAAISLTMFEESPLTMSPSREQWRAARDAESEIARRYEAELSPDLPMAARLAASRPIRDRAKVEARRAAWAGGRLPESYARRMPLIHAKSCVYALDTMGKALRQLAKLPSPPTDVVQAAADFGTALPSLVHVRDSAHHAEERVQGKRKGSTIELQPVSNPVVHAPSGGALVVDLLNGNSFGSTLADGTCGEVEISSRTIGSARDIVQRVLDAYAWSGPQEHRPA